jgi:hypothetical protein
MGSFGGCYHCFEKERERYKEEKVDKFNQQLTHPRLDIWIRLVGWDSMETVESFRVTSNSHGLFRTKTYLLL